MTLTARNATRPARTVLVTGAASGIGRAIARQFAEQGGLVVLVDVSASVHEVAASMGSGEAQAVGLVADLGNDAQLMEMIGQVQQRFGGCDVLVNCAGVAPKKDGNPIPLSELSTLDWERVLRINLTAPFVLCREFLPGMQSRGFGRIVNIASITGRTFRPRAGIDYAVSKAALMGLTRRLAGEYAPFGITVNSVAPGRVQTPMSGKSQQESEAIARTTIPMQRGGQVDEVAAAVLFLASDEASYITGTCMDVNGGDFIA